MVQREGQGVTLSDERLPLRCWLGLPNAMLTRAGATGECPPPLFASRIVTDGEDPQGASEAAAAAHRARPAGRRPRSGAARNILCADNFRVQRTGSGVRTSGCCQPYHGGHADTCAAPREADDLPPHQRWNGLAGDAMHERISRHGGRRGEYERQCDPQDRGAQHGKQKGQNAEDDATPATMPTIPAPIHPAPVP